MSKRNGYANNSSSKSGGYAKMTFAASVIIISLAHLVRLYRWKLFISVYETPCTSSLLRSLSAGYTVSLFLPFKLGDVVRAWLSGRKMKSGKSLGFSTVIIDRYLDILVVGAIFAVFAFADVFGSEMKNTLLFYASLALGLLLLSLLFYVARGFVKRAVKALASVFAPDIELKMLKFSWALIRNFKDIAKRISKWRLLLSTALMWLLYIASYFFFAEFLSAHGFSFGWTDMFYALFAKNSIQVGGYNLTLVFRNTSVFYILYMALQFAILFALSFVRFPARRSEEQSETQKINLLPHTNKDERLRFLELYFSNEHRSYIENYLRINQNILILRDYSAGSNATTMLCMDSEGNFFRKYAFGADGEKLHEQVEWLQKYEGILPLPKILRYGKEAEFCWYDMPSPNNASGLFEYAHSMPQEKSWAVIEETLNTLEEKLYTKNRRKADAKTVGKYIETKVQKNIEKIVCARHLKPLMKYDEVVINGRAFKNLQHYMPILGKENLEAVFMDDDYSEIHGDLTIENIICTRETSGKDSWYIIDPNTGNVHDSPNLDYAKLLQSIGGGYEFLMKTQSVSVEESRINFIFTKSQVYETLHKKLDDFMRENFSYERVRSIYYHHIIHWLRLMPYKIEKNGIRCVLFYAGLLMVLDEVERKFGGVR